LRIPASSPAALKELSEKPYKGVVVIMCSRKFDDVQLFIV
jgi:hypothetical protein